jgi:hypothetical protein
MNTATVTRPVVAPAQTRRWLARVLVPGCDQFRGRPVAGDVDIVLGEFKAQPGEVYQAWDEARRLIEPLGCIVDTVYPDGGYDQEF